MPGPQTLSLRGQAGCSEVVANMDRSHYKIFSKGTIAGLTIPNRLVRSATWDPSILTSRRMTSEVLAFTVTSLMAGLA